MPLPVTARVQIPADVMIREISGESFILNIKTERYFGLDSVGTRMVNVLAGSPSVNEALQVLEREYDVEPAVLRTDLDKLVEELLRHGLVDVIEEVPK